MKIKKLFALMAMAFTMTLVSCSGADDYDNDDVDIPENAVLSVKLSKNIIKADGVDAADVEVYLNEKKISTDKVGFYTFGTNQKVDIVDGKFKCKVAGTITFWALYKTCNTMERPTIIRAVDVDIPEAPKDPAPGKLNFAKHSFFIQFTGTGCPNCPYMIAGFEQLAKDPEAQGKYVHAVVHSYNANDPYYLQYPVATTLTSAFKVNGAPYVFMGMKFLLDGAYSNITYQTQFLKNHLMDNYALGAHSGISANINVSANTAVIGVSVKVSESNEYRVGAWLLEDGLPANQAGYGNMIHENCVRIADSEASKKDWSGLPLGYITKGESASNLFVFNLEEGWKKENMHVVLFVSAKGDNGKFDVDNAIDIPLTSSEVGFSYTD